MNHSAEQIEILFEMAMAIGDSIELRPMLRKSLSTILKKLNCSAGAVHFFEADDDVAFQKDPIYSIPRDVSSNATYQLALEQLTGLVDADGVANLGSKLPLSGDGGSSSYYYLLQLPNLGAVILVKNGQELDPLVVKSLDPLMRKLASACATCLQNEALQSVSARNQAMLNGIPDLLFFIDRTGRLLDFQIGEHYDIPVRSLEGLETRQHLDYFLGEEAASQTLQFIEKTLDSGETQVFELKHRSRDYECRMVSAGPDEVLAIVRDITELMQIQKEQRESEKTMRALLDASTASALLMKPDGTIVAMNEVLATSIGQDRDLLVGQNIYDFFPASVAKSRLAQGETVVRTGRPIRFEDSRAEKWFDVQIYPIFDAAGQVKLLGIHAHDITDRKRAEESLQAILLRTESLYRVSRSLVAIDDLPSLLQKFSDDVAAILSADRVSLITFDWLTENITHFIKGGPSRAKIIEVAYDELQQGLTGWALAEGQPALSPKGVPDPRESPAVQQRRRETDAGSIIVVPIQYQETVLGTITAINRTDQPDFTQEDVNLLVMLTNQAAAGVANARLLESLRERESRIQAIINTAPDGIITIDEQGIVESFNPAAAQLFGYRAGEIIGQNVNILMPAPHAEQHDQYLANYLETGQQKIIGIGREEMGRRKDGSLFPMYLAVGEVQLKNRRLFTGIIQDLSEVKQSEQTLGAVLNAVGEAIITIDTTGTIVMANREVQNIWGYSEQELTGQSITNLMPEQYRAPHRAGMERYLRTGEPHVLGQRIELEGLRRDGTTFPAETKISETRVGERLLFTAAVRDVTRRKELDKMRDDFVSTVSHELRTPLASIMGFVETILSGRPGPLTDIQQRFLENSYKSSERLLKLIEELLTVSRIQRGTFQISKRLFLPSDAVHNVQEMVSNLAQAEAVTLDITADWAGQQMLDGDQDRLEQVMTNLISNAIKFTPEGGQVTVQSRHEAGQWHFTVEDTGIGIPEADLPRLFDRFYRASNARQSEIQGTGLGLYVCKAIVEQHGGQIGLDSREGVGTSAWFTVPVSSEPVKEQG